MKKPKVISLFCGAGGCSLGFRNAGYKVLYSSDIEISAINTYQHNFKDTFSEVKDIKRIDCQNLLKKLNLKMGELDFLIGGPPCQGFSTAGTKFWDDPRNILLKEYIRCLNELKPKWFLMENVEGLLTSKKGAYVFEAAKAFMELGYSIRIEKIYSHEYGIPQRRKRVIIVGNRSNIDFSFPKPTNYATGKIFKNSSITLLDSLDNLPLPANKIGEVVSYPNKIKENSLFEYFKNKQNSISDHFAPKINDTQLKRIKHIKEGQSMKDLPEELQHESFKRRANRRVKDGTPSEKRGGAPTGLKRLIASQPSLTITSAATREFIHPFQDRPLTIRECARIQTFPDNFDFLGSQSQKIKQIGNAIPPLLAQCFAEHIAKNYGFQNEENSPKGKLLGFSLSKSNGLSPALKNTKRMLSELKNHSVHQLNLF